MKFFCILLVSLLTKVWADSKCLLEPQTGSCTKYSVRFYFNRFTGECHEFMYGGCGGNDNRFNIRKECEEYCNGMAVEKSADCGKLPDSGPCRGHIERFYFDKWSKKCITFEYGGCRGNGNNFNTVHECLATCKTN